MTYRDKEASPMGYLAVFLVIAMFIVGAWVWRSGMEAKAYNRVTGANVTTWDAMFLELRVDGSPK